MQDDVADGYRIADLSDYSEAQLFRLIKTHWGYGNAQPFDIIGRLKEIPTGTWGSFFIIEELRSANDGSVLLYPLNEADVRQTVFVGVVNKSLFGNESIVGAWAKVRVELSPEKERVKHKNPFALKAANGGLQLLQAIPEEAVNPEVFIEGESLVEKWVIDFYRNQHRERIAEEGDALRERLQQQCELEEGRVLELRGEAKTLDDKVMQQAEALQKLAGKLAVTRDLREKAEAEFTQRKKTMEQQLNTLNQFIEKKRKCFWS